MAKKTGKELADTAKNMVLESLAEKGKLVKAVDATPDWTGLVPLFIEWIQDGNSEQHLQASESIMQMARISDSYRKNKLLFEASADMYEALKKVQKMLADWEEKDQESFNQYCHIDAHIETDKSVSKAEGKKNPYKK